MEHDRVDSAGSEPNGRHLGCSMTSSLLSLVRAEGGSAAVDELLRVSGTPYDERYLDDPSNWISVDEGEALLHAGAEVTGDPAMARRVGEHFVSRHAGTGVATLLRSLGSPEEILANVAQAASKFSVVSEFTALEVQPGRARIQARARPGFVRKPVLCEWTIGLLSQCTVLFGLPPATVTESQCQAAGADSCIYEVTWDKVLAEAAADPEQRVTALEAQVVALSERMRSIYATAGDLVSPEDLDSLLTRIVERAGETVRAPRYVLAVRTQPDDRLRVYGKGLSDAEAEAVARAAMEAETGPSTLVVDVASSRNRHGLLVALYPEGVEFFGQERELLSLYAKHAAAVLDMATALDDASRRHALSSALLALSRTLAEASTTHEVVLQLAEAVPNVVDCDTVAVHLWDRREETMNMVAGHGFSESARADLEHMRIGLAETDELGTMLGEPGPRFYRADSAEPFVAGMLQRAGLAAASVVPIISGGDFLGVLSVGTAEQPERLELGSDLVERLTGVAALAAPAIQNGLLVDELHFQATHDALTGLVNRQGFGGRADGALERARTGEGPLALVFIDLDHFKRVNDTGGHEAGDALLAAVAERLRGRVRGGDFVARLGGDEFAVVVSGLRSADELSAAMNRLRDAFADPFSVGGERVQIEASVGGALWPRDGQTLTELVRRADAAMYREKAEHHASAA
jgi:diguanylate cyclase (GGDEF)-like protein